MNAADDRSDPGAGGPRTPGTTAEAANPGAEAIDGRVAFQKAVFTVLDTCAQAQVPQLWLCDTDFADWPLGQPAFIEALTRWIGARRQLTLIAARYDHFNAQFPRWVNWRRQWSHTVRCLAVHEERAAQVPTLMCAVPSIALRLHDPERKRGRIYRDERELRRCLEVVDALSQRSEESFPVTTLGL